MASTYLTRTPSSETANGRRKWTFSCWMKRADTSGFELFGADADGARNNNYHILDFSGTNDHLDFNAYESASIFRLKTTRKFRDVNAWYHILIAWDTTQATASDRVKIYVNGVRETAFDLENYPSQNYQGKIFSSGKIHHIGGRSGAYFNGVLSHIHACEGYVYQPSDFGSTDATTGEWQINTSPSVTYGTNGFFILKDGNSVTDQSGNGNNFTVAGGTLTNTEDSPSNVFCTLNPLGLNADVTFASGNNNAIYGTSGTRSIVTGTLGANSGKYYWECEIQGSVSANNAVLGVSMSGWETGYSVAGETNQSWGFKGYDGAVQNNNSSVGGTWATFTNGDIIGVAINLDDEQDGLNKLYFSKNGTWLNGADPSNHSATTGVVGITKPENGDSGFYFPVISDAGSSATPKFKMNFGNGYFGTVAVSSAGTNKSGIGIFEYDVPTGFTALSTKGLNL